MQYRTRYTTNANGGSYAGFANRETYMWDVVTSNDRELYAAMIDHARRLLTPRPRMTDQTLGMNLREHARSMVAVSRGEVEANTYDTDTPFYAVPASTWRELGDAVGDLRYVDTTEIGESIRRAALGE